MRFLFFIFLLIAIVALSWYLYQLYQQRQGLTKEAAKLLKEIGPFQEENQELTGELQRLENPDNLEKELRKAGYAIPGEKVLIIVPKEN